MSSFLSLAVLLATGVAQSTFSPTRPPAIPLAVSNPYLNTWLFAGSDGGNGGYLAGQWPQFWAGQVTGWTGIIKVDGGDAVTWMGAPRNVPSVVTQKSFEYTSTKSIFTLEVGNAVGLNVTFLTPVEPMDLQRKSIPASYMNVDVYSIDGSEHDVQLYTDVSAEWASGDRSAIAEWDTGTIATNTSSRKRQDSDGPSTFATMTVPASSVPRTATSTFTSSSPTVSGLSGGLAYHRFYRQDQQEFRENSDQASWGHYIYACDHENLTYSNGGVDDDVRSAFITNGFLKNEANKDFRAINNNYPVFAFALDLGSVGSSSSQSALFTLTFAQDNAIQFEYAKDEIKSLPPLWKSWFSDELDLVSFFYNDWSHAQTCASTLDSKVASDSVANGGDDYLTITSLAVRQAFATTHLAGSGNDTHLFMKEISSNGDMQTVDVIFPAFPIFLYFNPDLARMLLDPLFINQETGNWPQAFAIHDLGVYPNATGHNDGNAEQMPLEECGNMIIMTLAVAQKTGNNDYLNSHYTILKEWNDYLILDSLIPSNQISTDDFAGSLANQTNLALKGIIGIQAMSQIANLTGHTSDASNFSSIAQSYISQWQVLANVNGTNGSLPHTTLSYNDPTSHGLLYNIYADSLLQTSIVPLSLYTQQSNFYSSISQTYGVPLDTRHSYTKFDWEIFCAAVASPETKSMFITKLTRWIGETSTNKPFTDLYETESGGYPPGLSFAARPVVGGVFAPLLVGHGPLG